VYTRCNNGPRPLPWEYTRTDWGEIRVLSSNFHEKVSAMRIGLK
jgi:hypothetical protein